MINRRPWRSGWRPSWADEGMPKSGALLIARGTLMDNEQINAIGNLLSDLTARTALLRGYL